MRTDVRVVVNVCVIFFSHVGIYHTLKDKTRLGVPDNFGQALIYDFKEVFIFGYVMKNGYETSRST